MGVVALAFFDPNTSRGPQRLPEFAIGKNANLALEPKRLEILIFFCFCDPHYFQISRGVSFIVLFDQRSFRVTYYKLSVNEPFCPKTSSKSDIMLSVDTRVAKRSGSNYIF
jgi:hypothetical protein